MLDIALYATDSPVQSRDIHRRQHIDEHFVSQILLMLRRAGLIESLRGRQGGHRLARPAEQIRVLDIIEALEGSDESHERSCNSTVAEALVVRDIWHSARQQARTVFVEMTLADLCDRRNLLGSASYDI